MMKFDPKHTTLLMFLGLGFTSAFAAETGEIRMAEEAFAAKRYTEGERILLRAARRGNLKAARILGNCYLRGRGVRQDYTDARFWLRKAAKEGSAGAMDDLSWLLEKGLGGAKDLKGAESLRGRAADLSSPEKLYEQGLNCMRGIDFIQDFSRAFKYFESSAKRGNSNAKCLLSFMYATGLGVEKQTQLSKTLMESAIIHGCASGEYEIGRNFLYGLAGSKDYRKAMEWFIKAAGHGNAHAMNEIGSMYSRGDGVPIDDSKGLKWQMLAADNGCPTATHNLANRYSIGSGVPKDVKKAKLLFEKAEKLGYEPEVRN